MGIKKMDKQGIAAKIVTNLVGAEAQKNKKEQPEEPEFKTPLAGPGILPWNGFYPGLGCVEVHRNKIKPPRRIELPILSWLDAILFSSHARGNQAAIFLCGEDQYGSARLQEAPVGDNPGYNRRVGRHFNRLFPVLVLDHNRPARAATDSADGAVRHGPI